MSLFIVDSAGDTDLLARNDKIDGIKVFDGTEKTAESENNLCDVEMDEPEDEKNLDFFGLPPPSKDISHIIEKALSRAYITENKEDENKVESLEEFMGWTKAKKEFGKTDVAKEMKGSVLRDIEDKKAIPCPSEKKLKQLRKEEREKTKGKDWFNMPATEVTEEVENDLKVLQMRKVLDPKRFYKKNDLKVLPKYFQIGTVQHSPLDHYSERNTRRNKKKTMVEELLADAEFQKFNKRKFKEIIEKRHQNGYRKAVQKMKKLKKAKKK